MGCNISSPALVPSRKPKETYRYDAIEKAVTNEYDARIITESFYSLLHGKTWPVQIKNWVQYQEHSKKNTSQIAVLGYEKTGKSFLLSRLMEQELAQGKHVKTQGICVLYPTNTEHPWTALDTPGTNVSVKAEFVKEEMKRYFQSKKFSDDEIMRMLFGDNILMEALLQEFVAHHAQVILIVIGKLRRDDQRLISRIKALPGKRVLIVHNLLECLDKANVADVIQEDIFGAFNVQARPIQALKNAKQEKNNVIYLEKDEKHIEHLVLAHERSPAGEYYNEPAYTYIREVINGFNYSQPFDLIQEFANHLNAHIRTYFSSNEDPRLEEPFKIEKGESGVPTSLILRNHTNYELKLSTANEFGNIHTYTREGLENVPFSVKRVSKGAESNSHDMLQLNLRLLVHVTMIIYNSEWRYQIIWSKL